MNTEVYKKFQMRYTYLGIEIGQSGRYGSFLLASISSTAKSAHHELLITLYEAIKSTSHVLLTARDASSGEERRAASCLLVGCTSGGRCHRESGPAWLRKRKSRP